MNHFFSNIEGWFSSEDREFYRSIVNYFNGPAHFVEVGSFKGLSSSFMAVEIINSGKSIKFDCVDTWGGSPEHNKNGAFEDRDVVSGTLYESFIKNMSPVEGYYNAIRMSSIEAAKLYQDQSLDFVFIDALHDYDNVSADIKSWLPKIKKGGIISGHDYHHPPIIRAVKDHVGEVRSMGSCWYYFVD